VTLHNFLHLIIGISGRTEGELLGAAAGGLKVYEGISALAGKIAPKVVNTALNAAIQTPATIQAAKSLTTKAFIYMGQKTIIPIATSIVAGTFEGGFKSYFGGPDTELGSSIFMNPISNATMNLTEQIWLTGSFPTYP